MAITQKTIANIESFTFTYRDGTEETKPVLPWHVLDAERQQFAGRKHGKTAAVEQGFAEQGFRFGYIVAETTLGFEEWVKTLAKSPKSNLVEETVDVAADDVEPLPGEDDLSPTSGE